MRSKILFLITFVLITFESVFSTTHEHFTYFFDHTDLSAARSSLDEMSIDRLGLVKKGQFESQALGANPALWTKNGVSNLSRMEQLMNQGVGYREASVRVSGMDLYGEVQKRIDDFARVNGKMPNYKWYNKTISELTGQTVEQVHRLNFSMDMKSLSPLDKVRSVAADNIRLNSYMSSDKIRKNLLLNLLEDGKKNEVLGIFQKAIERVPLQSRRRIVFGLPNEFVHTSFEGRTFNGPDLLKDLKAIAQKNGSSWEFLTSFVRNQIETAPALHGTQYNLDLEETVKGIKKGYLDGADFAGSIVEENSATTNGEKALNKLRLEFASANATPAEKAVLSEGEAVLSRYNSEMHNLNAEEFAKLDAQRKKYFEVVDQVVKRKATVEFNVASAQLNKQIQVGIDWHAKVLESISKNGGAIRFHAMEGAWDGVFYDEHLFGNLERLLEKSKTNPNILPKELFIGHSAGLDAKTNKRLYDLLDRLKAAMPDMKFIVEMNVTSNAMLQSKLSPQGKSIYQVLGETVEELHKRGIQVAIGSDGLGKMGSAATLDNQLELLKNSGLKRADAVRLKNNSIKIPTRLKIDPKPCNPIYRTLSVMKPIHP